MKFDKYECENQMTIFDFIKDEKPQKTVEQCVKRELLRGSGFEGGKERIYKFFKEHEKEGERVAFLKNEYGVGGWSTEEGWCNYNGNGIDITFHDYKVENVKAIHLGWPMVSRRIHKLIKIGEYNKCKLSGHQCNKEVLWEVAKSFDDVVCQKKCCRACDQKLCGARCNGG